MPKVFGETSTTDEVLSAVNLKDKRVLVTGVSSGLGVETARSLAAHGAQVVGAARDLKKANAATNQVRKDAAANGGSFEVIALDLASLTSVRACADALLKKGEPFDVIIANAGVMATPFGHTEDGFETQFGTNHLGHFVLVNRIAPLLRPGGRLINLASAGHRYANVDLQDANFERTPYDPWVAYGRSRQPTSFLQLLSTRAIATAGFAPPPSILEASKPSLLGISTRLSCKRRSTESAKNPQQHAGSLLSTRRFLKEPPLRSGLALSRPLKRSVDDIARTATSADRPRGQAADNQ